MSIYKFNSGLKVHISVSLTCNDEGLKWEYKGYNHKSETK